MALRISCKACRFTGPLRARVGLRTDEEICRKIARESLERASIRILARRYEKSKDTITEIVHRVTESLPGSVSIAQKFRPLWSGVLVFDGKVVRVYDKLAQKFDRHHLTDDERRWMHKMRWLCGMDYGTGDLPHYELADSESKIDLVMYFKTLKSLNYPLKALVSDGNHDIPKAARFVFGAGFVHQRCTRHFTEDLKRLLPNEEGKEAERAQLEGLIVRIQRVIEAESLAQASASLAELRRYSRSCASPIERTMLRMFKKAAEKLTAHLLYSELSLPHTTNDIESLFKQLMLRLRSLGRFYHHRYARNYLKAWALLRRFTPFTDCRGGRRHRNRKAPLELAGCEIKNIDPLKLRD